MFHKRWRTSSARRKVEVRSCNVKLEVIQCKLYLYAAVVLSVRGPGKKGQILFLCIFLRVIFILEATSRFCEVGG